MAGTCFCAGMVLQVRGHGSLVEVVGSMVASPHQLEEGGGKSSKVAATASVLAPQAAAASKLEASKMKGLQKRKKSSGGVRSQG